MICTGIFLFLLGTKFGQSAIIESEVKYEGPSKITIKENNDNDHNQHPEFEVSRYGSSIIHHGSNFFFGSNVPLPAEFSLPAPGTFITEQRVISKPANVLEREPIIIKEAPMSINAHDAIVVNEPKRFPVPSVGHKVQPVPYFPPFAVPIINPQAHPLQLFPLPVNPSTPLAKTPEPLYAVIEETNNAAHEVIDSDVVVEITKIPPPPELPPLYLEEILKPVNVEEKKVIMIPELPALPAFDKPLIYTQDILLERILPNIACEQSKSVEIISIPAAKRVPVVTSSSLPFFKK